VAAGAALALLGALTPVSTSPAGVPSSPPLVTAQVLVIGDSLAAGIEPFLGDLLTYRDVIWDARAGRTTPQGLRALRANLRTVAPQTVIVSLGTNDGSDAARFASRVRRVLRAVPARACVVWPAISRAARKGPYGALNRVLREEARRDHRLVVPGWDHAVSRGSVVLPDGVHPDTQGYRYRSRMIAAATYEGCLREDAHRRG